MSIGHVLKSQPHIQYFLKQVLYEQPGNIYRRLYLEYLPGLQNF